MNSKEKFIKVIKENAGLIYKVTKVYTNSREDEQDLYQEIVYQLWKSFGSFRSESKISTWMYRIALNTAIAHLNKEKRKGSYIPIDELLLNKPDLNDTLKEEQVEILYSQIKKLDTIEKGIILLYLEGKSYDEIAGITGFSTTNVGTRLGRIKQKLITQIN
ncbi:RNA polymerase sigma factor [Mucilaginibacter sp. OK098]|uniref:RNA polymerase sigma factor n=1 Tax=Mucilaginibacter sp. OK098 TaxID=1855297 RepID=UPI00091744A7|nr:RNA polymerase sigma factor [Mucilaginibacter sp. OK098]SHN20144.1 RNA polymerase sigma-70 factor, ECF subfamily [Mucilaginibacter sp. OK098]